MTIEPYFHVKDDTYCDPDSNVLRNLLGITDYDELVSAEGRLTMMAMTQLDVDPVKGCFDTEHLRTIHRCIFKDIYDWAGEFRTVEISKGIPFCYCANIQSQLDSIFAQLHKENLLKDITDNGQVCDGHLCDLLRPEVQGAQVLQRERYPHQRRHLGRRCAPPQGRRQVRRGEGSTDTSGRVPVPHPLLRSEGEARQGDRCDHQGAVPRHRPYGRIPC